jgi:hypothetical protein
LQVANARAGTYYLFLAQRPNKAEANAFGQPTAKPSETAYYKTAALKIQHQSVDLNLSKHEEELYG